MSGGADMNGSGVTGARELLVIAVGVALEASQPLASKEGRVEVAATKSSPTDVVTEMDGRAEELIRARILVARPDDAILGEEGGQVDGAADAPARWVVDPLDGTVNYLYGLHDWACRSPLRLAARSWRARSTSRCGRAVHRRPRRGRLAGGHRGGRRPGRANPPSPTRPSSGFRSAAGPGCRSTRR